MLGASLEALHKNLCCLIENEKHIGVLLHLIKVVGFFAIYNFLVRVRTFNEYSLRKAWGNMVDSFFCSLRKVAFSYFLRYSFLSLHNTDHTTSYSFCF